MAILRPERALLLFAMVTAPFYANAEMSEFPDLDLSWSPRELRSWAQENAFKRTQASEPDQEAFLRAWQDGRAHTLSFNAAGDKINFVSYEQNGVFSAAHLLRLSIIESYGEPAKDETIGSNIIRLTYPLKEGYSGLRIFMMQNNYVSMSLGTNEYFAELERRFEERESGESALAVEESNQTVSPSERWWRNSIVVAAIALSLLFLLRIAPVQIREGILEYVGGSIRALIMYLLFILHWLLMIVAAIASIGRALEGVTSWWWALPWVAGLLMMIKFDEEGNPKAFALSYVFFLVSILGVIGQLYFYGPK